MFVVQLEPPSLYVQGDQVLRTHQPCHSLVEADEQVTVVAGTWLSPLARMLAEVADVLVLAQAVWVDFLPLLQRRRAAGLRTLFEINDHFAAVPDFNPVAGYWQAQHNQALLLRLGDLSDGLQFSSHGLMQRFGWLKPHSALFANQMAQVPPWPAQRWARPQPLCVGWAGSGGHRRDVEAVVPALRQAAAACPQLQVCIMGQQDLLDAFAHWPSQRLLLRRPGSYHDYQRFLGRLHVGLAPLSDTPFNACRSDVKFVEYAAHGVMPLLCDAPTYRHTARAGQTALFFADGAQLATTLEALVAAPQRAEAVAQGAWAYVAAQRLQSQQAPARLALMRRLGAGGGRRDARAASALVAAAFRRHPAAALRPHRRFWQLQGEGCEVALVDLLVDDQGSAPERQQRLAKVAAQSPDDYLPQLMLGRCHPQVQAGLAALERAERLLPWGCEAPYARGLRLLEAGQPAAAAAALTGAVRRAPQLAVAHEALARLALDAGQAAAAADHLAAAVQANPFYRPPARALQQLIFAGRASPAARQRLQASAPPWPALAADDAEAMVQLAPPARQQAWAAAAAAVHPQVPALAALAARCALRSGRLAEARRLMAHSRAMATSPPPQVHPLAR